MIAQDWLTPARVGRRLELSAERVRQLATEGRLACIRTPHGRLIIPRSLEHLAAERAARPRLHVYQ